MRILYILTASTGGTAAFVEGLVGFFSQNNQIFVLQGYEDYFKNRFYTYSINKNNVEWTYINLKGQFDVNSIANVSNPSFNKLFYNYLANIRPDIAHIHSLSNIGVSIIDVLKSKAIPMVFTVHDFWAACPMYYFVTTKMQICKKIENYSVKKCCLKEKFIKERNEVIQQAMKKIDCITAPSEIVKKFFEKFFNFHVPIRVIEHRLPIDKSVSLKVEKCPSNKIRFGYLGGFNPYKGLPVILKAIKDIKEPFILKIGGVSFVENIFVKKYGIGMRVVYLIHRLVLNNRIFLQKLFLILNIQMIKFGKNNIKIEIIPRITKKEMAEFYNNVDILLVPSIMQETYNILVRESLVYKTPVIASKCGGPETVLRDGVNGFLVAMNDPVALREKMLLILRNPANALEKLKSGMENSFVTNNTSRNFEDFAEIYKDLLSR